MALKVVVDMARVSTVSVADSVLNVQPAIENAQLPIRSSV